MYYDLEEKHKHEKQSSYELGVEHGMEQGIKEGSKQNSIEIAKKMLAENEQIEKIMNYTNLTEEEIKNLIN